MRANQRGSMLLDVLVATAIVVVGLSAIAAGFQYAVELVEASRQHTTALFLASQRLEQVKARALLDFAGVTDATFPAEDPVLGYPLYRRMVEITPAPASLTDAVGVRVTVAYRPPGGRGPAPVPRTVSLATVLARRQ